MSQGDMGHTGRAAYTIAASRLNSQLFSDYLWQTRSPGPLGSDSMSFFDGVGPGGTNLVVGGYHWPKGIQGMDAQTGQIYWSGNTSGGEGIANVTPAFSANGSTIYVTSDATYPTPLMALPAATGPGTYYSFTTSPSFDGGGSPVIAPDGRIFVIGPYGVTDNGTSLTQTWSAAASVSSVYSSPSLYQNGSQLIVVATGEAGVIDAFSGTSGATLWSTNVSLGTDATPTIDPANGKIYVPVGGDSVYIAGLNASGGRLWSSTTKLVYSDSGGTDPQRVQGAGALSFDGSTYYFQTVSTLGNGKLYAINTSTGAVRWSYATQSKEIQSDVGQPVSSPIVTQNGIIIVGNNENDEYFAIQDNGSSATLIATIQTYAGLPGDIPTYAVASATISPSGTLYLPMRVQELVGSPTQPPTGSIQYLFCAMDLTANPVVKLVMVDPRGIAAGTSGKIAVAEGNVDRVGIFDSTGTRTNTFGTLGSGNGQLNTPTDVAFDSSGNLWVVDSGNNRIEEFSPTGTYLAQFGSAGTAAGQFNAPQGIFIDAAGKIYVADTGNERIQRFNPNGTAAPTIDTTWGTGGIVGTTGTVVRSTHTGFDIPTDMAVNPLNTNEVYILDSSWNHNTTSPDYGNARIEVYSTAGVYLRSYLSVYEVNQMAFDSAGNLYLAGEDPNEGYNPYDGRLRVLKPGESLITANYTGTPAGAAVAQGLDDIERVETGVAVRSDGSIVFADSFNARLVVTDAAFDVPAYGLSVVNKGTQVTFSWTTRVPCISEVQYGTSFGLMTGLQTDSTVTTNHVVTVTGLTPNTRLWYGVGFADTFDGHIRFSLTDVINTGVASGHQILRLKTAALIYMDGNANAGYTQRTDLTLAQIEQIYKDVAQFYYQNSYFSLWCDVTFVVITTDLVVPSGSSYDAWAHADADLQAAGYTSADDFDEVWENCVFAGGDFGGGGYALGRSVGMCEFGDSDWYLTHEGNHTLDSIYYMLGLTKYEFCHGIWAVPGGLGRDFMTNGQILRNMMPSNLTAGAAPFTKVIVAADADSDGVPDSSPPGLTNPLPITEATAGTSTGSADTDGDGLSDLTELMNGTNPLVADTTGIKDANGNSIPDGENPDPKYKINYQIAKATPNMSSTTSIGSGWTVLTSDWGWTGGSGPTLNLQGNNTDDSDAYQSTTVTYAAWDNNYLYLAYQGQQCTSDVRIDGDADNWFLSPDNYDLQLGSGSTSTLSIADNVGVPDIFRQIDNDGQFSEIFDTDPMFTRPYQGRPACFYATDGLGFPGRLVTESQLTYVHGTGSGGTGGTNNIWKVAIPWSNVTDFHGGDGKWMALFYKIGNSDLLFANDDFARVQLVDGTPSNIALSSQSVNEQQPAGTTVGTFFTTDSKSGHTFTYSLVNGPGSTGNSAFTISGNALQTAYTFDWATQSSYSIRVRTTDEGGVYYEQSFTISVIPLVRQNQTVSFGPIPNHVYGDVFALSATASSGLPLSFSVLSGPAAIVNSTLTVTGLGAITVQASQAGNAVYYPASANASFTANVAPLTVTANNVSMVYGAAALPTLTANYSGLVNGDTSASLTTQPTLSTTATVGCHVSGNPYRITVSGAVDSNYSISYVFGTFTVTPASLTITANNQTKAYGAALPTLTFGYSGFVNGDTSARLTTQPTLSTTATASSQVSGNPYSITASGAVDADYAFTYIPGTLTVTAVPLTVTADNQTKAYGAALPTLTASYSGLVNGDTPASLANQVILSTTATAASHVSGNPYSITAAGAADADYTVTCVPGTLTVTVVPLTVTADNKTKAYGAALPTLTASYSGLVNGDTSASLTTQPTLSTTATAASHPSGNPYSITVSGAADPDYTITYVSGTLTVTPASLAITANNKTKAYGAALPTLTASYSGFINGDTSASLTTQPTLSTTATAGSHVSGSPYSITASGAADPDYSITYVSGSLAVTAVPLTITANNKTKAYGAAMPTLNASYSGLVNGDTSASLTTPPTLSSTATAASHVSGSPYSITASGAVDSDYTISYVSGSLAVTAVPLTITANNKTKVYGAAMPALTASYSGLVNGDTSASLTTQPTLTTTATAASHVSGSPYSITVSGAVDSDYTITYVSGSLAVTAAPLTITANNQTKVYGAAMPALTAGYSGLVNGDSSASLTTQPTLTTTATAQSHVSGNPYSITASGAVDSDYSISYAAGTLTVTAAPLTITADNKTKVYGAALPTFTASYNGFVNGDTSGSLTTQPTLSTTATAASDVSGSPYAITASGAADPDYGISYVAGSLTVVKSGTAVQLVSSVATADYGQSVTFTATASAVLPGSGTPSGTSTFWDGGSELGAGALDASGTASAATSALGPGSHTITASYGGDGNFNTSTSANVTEVVRPHTTATLSGTMGSNGWYTSSVIVTLSTLAETPGSSVAATYYQVDNSGSWATYTGPFTISSNGVHPISFYSVDNAGNQEAAQGTTVMINTSLPVVSVGNAGAVTFIRGGAAIAVAPNLTVTDANYTNLASATVSISGGPLDAAVETLAATTAGTSITATYNGTTGVLTLSNTDTLRTISKCCGA